MTSNERKIINFLRDAKEKMHIRLIAKKTNFSSDYTQSLCHSLACAGYIKLENSNICHLLEKGRGCFESIAVMREISEPVAVTANVTLLTDEPATPLAIDSDDKADDDIELDKDLAGLELSSQNDESEEEKDKLEEPKDETEDESSEKGEETEEIVEEPKEETNTDKKEDALDKEVLAETKATEGEKMEKPDETEKPEPKTWEEKPAVTEAVAGKEKELTEEEKAENPEKIALREESAQPSSGFGASFKKVVPIARLSSILDKVGINWFAEKK